MASSTDIAVRFFLHGWGSSAVRFRSLWPPSQLHGACRFFFLDGVEHDELTGERRWFPFSNQDSTLARYVSERGKVVEKLIQQALASLGEPEDARIALSGHSQGGMIALDLAGHSCLNIACVDAYAAYLPTAGRMAASSNKAPRHVVLHASRADKYVPFAKVQNTVEGLQAVTNHHVELRVFDSLPHSFSAAWLNPAAQGSVDYV